jgi:hypothetical protein
MRGVGTCGEVWGGVGRDNTRLVVEEVGERHHAHPVETVDVESTRRHPRRGDEEGTEGPLPPGAAFKRRRGAGMWGALRAESFRVSSVVVRSFALAVDNGHPEGLLRHTFSQTSHAHPNECSPHLTPRG